MATIVEQESTGKRFILLGTGFGAYQSEERTYWFGIRQKTKGRIAVAAVCDREGMIGWIPTEELTVVAIDGMSPAKAL